MLRSATSTSPSDIFDHALDETLLWLCAIQSPIGDEKKICDAVEERMLKLKLAAPVRRYKNSIVVPLTRMKEQGRPKLALVGHLDTVRTENGLPRLDDGRCYGSGAADMKSGLSIMIAVAETMLAFIDFDLTLVFYSKEEGPFADNELGEVLDKDPDLKNVDLAICLEPSDNRVHLGCNGSLHATVTFDGKTGHSARPWEAENAITKAAHFMAEMGALRPEDHVIDGHTYKSVFTITQAKDGGRGRNVVPDKFLLNINHRFTPDTTIEQAEARLRELVAGRAHVEIIDRSPPAPPNVEHPLIKKLIDCGVVGVEPKQAWTDVARFAQHGVAAVNFGPGENAQAHQKNESTSLALLHDGFRIMKRYLASLRGRLNMAKDVVQFVCQACGAITPKWIGRCGQCSAWNTIVEEISRTRSSGKIGGSFPVAKAQLVSAIDADHAARVPTEIAELDRVLGGGVVLGGVVLVGGDPGVGKSTLLLQALSALSAKGCRALYVSGEESAGQTAARARRLGVLSDDLLVLAENDLDAVERCIEETKPAVLVIDSVQTVRSPDLESAAGSVSQLREVAARIVDRAKRSRIAAFLVGHVTKDGSLAGPKVLEHLVDTVLAFEGERGHSLRTLRAHKNRFGSATEVGVFEMTADGMRQVPNASAFFLSERPKNVAGSIVAATSEGSRSMLVEVQALTVVQSSGSPRRTVSGVDGARLAMILAVLERKSGLHVSGCDVFVNVAGGVHVDEPAMDLPIALAIASSLNDRPVHPEIVAFGEIGLSGEVRAVPRAEARIAEASALGFRRAILPASVAEKFTKNIKDGKSDGGQMHLAPVRSLDEALAIAM